VTWRSSDGQLKFYKDAVDSFTDTFQQGASMATSGFLVFGQDQDTPGGLFDPNQAFNGTMDEMRIWNVVLDATTIQDWMCKKVTSDHPNYTQRRLKLRFFCDGPLACPIFTLG